MICWWARRALIAYQDGELKQTKAERLEAHIKACPRCQREFEQLRRLRLLFRSVARPSWPEPDRAQAFQRLREKIQLLPPPATSSLFSRVGDVVESFPRAWLPATLAGAALINTLVGLELEEEALIFLSSYILPFIFD
jgi:anti-sigma factor RsiW